jgi:hypothetical protein
VKLLIIGAIPLSELLFVGRPSPRLIFKKSKISLQIDRKQDSQAYYLIINNNNSFVYNKSLQNTLNYNNKLNKVTY